LVVISILLKARFTKDLTSRKALGEKTLSGFFKFFDALSIHFVPVTWMKTVYVLFTTDKRIFEGKWFTSKQALD
jgi:transcriptional regulator of nitric oxide reductase